MVPIWKSSLFTARRSIIAGGTRLQKGERLVDFCFQTDDLRGDTKKLQDAGVAINNPVPWSRKRPDGYELKWLLVARHRQPPRRGAVSDRRRDAAQRADSPAVRSMPIRSPASKSVTVAVGELGANRQMVWRAARRKGEPFADADSRRRRLALQSRPAYLGLSRRRASADSPLVDWLREFGPSPYSAV